MVTTNNIGVFSSIYSRQSDQEFAGMPISSVDQDYWSLIDGNQQTDYRFVSPQFRTSRIEDSAGRYYLLTPGGGSYALRAYHLVFANVIWLLLDDQKKYDADKNSGAPRELAELIIGGGNAGEIKAIKKAFEYSKGIAGIIQAHPGNYRENYRNYMEGFKLGFNRGYWSQAAISIGNPIAMAGFQMGYWIAKTSQDDGTIERAIPPLGSIRGQNF